MLFRSGGWIALRLAQLRPEMISGLVLEDSAGASRAEENTIAGVNSSHFPVLIIWGENDKIVPVEAARYLHSRITKSTLEIFEDAGHVPHWEAPERFDEVVAAFLHSL